MSRETSEQQYIKEVLWPELAQKFAGWGEEYRHQERDLGIRGEFVGLYRKVRKIKSIVWDGVDDSKWREGLRIMLFEVIAHAFLMLRDLDTEQNLKTLTEIANSQDMTHVYDFSNGVPGWPELEPGTYRTDGIDPRTGHAITPRRVVGIQRRTPLPFTKKREF